MSLNTYCKAYRMKKRVAVAQMITEDIDKHSLYAFESERSSSARHLTHYIKLAEKNGELEPFMMGLAKEILNG